MSARVTTVFRNTALQFFTNNFGILRFGFSNLGSLHENCFCCVEASFAGKHATALLLGLVRLLNGNLKTQNKESTVKMGIRTNGNLGQHLKKQATKWDPILSRTYCTPT